jgi:hypothetical protein
MMGKAAPSSSVVGKMVAKAMNAVRRCSPETTCSTTGRVRSAATRACSRLMTATERMAVTPIAHSMAAATSSQLARRLMSGATR